MFSAELEGVEELATTWKSVCSVIRAGMQRGVSDGVREGAADARSGHSFKNQTGELERSIQGRATHSGLPSDPDGDDGAPPGHPSPARLEPHDGAFFGVIEATAPHASFVEKGTRPHVIAPIRGTRLVFQWHGEWHSAGTVHHPGTRAQPFMSIAYYKCERVMVREIERGVEDAQMLLDR